MTFSFLFLLTKYLFPTLFVFFFRYTHRSWHITFPCSVGFIKYTLVTHLAYFKIIFFFKGLPFSFCLIDFLRCPNNRLGIKFLAVLVVTFISFFSFSFYEQSFSLVYHLAYNDILVVLFCVFFYVSALLLFTFFLFLFMIRHNYFLFIFSFGQTVM